jgi:copper homeostasis protein (lipoprotein)
MGAANGLGGVEWTLVELDGTPLDLAGDERGPSLLLDLEESSVTGSGGCNRVVGSFALAEDELRFGALATTRMACSEAVMKREQDFLAALARVTAYGLEEQSLVLLAGDEVVARLTC